jgi:hypothetical protein
MSEANAAPTTPTTEANGSGVVLKSYEERVAEAFGGPTEQPAAPNAPAAAPAAVEPDENAKARAERRAALEKLKADERTKVDTTTARRELDELRNQLNAEREKNKAYEKYVDPSKLTKDQFFRLYEQNPELSPKELGEWLRERMADPEAAATQAATRAVDPKLAALEKKIADQQAVIDNFMNQQQSAQAEAAEQAYARQFFSFTQENAATSPLSARFLAKHGADEYYRLAQSAVQNVPAHAGPQAILDEIEEQLTALGQIYQPEQGTPQRRPATAPQPNPAAAQAPTHVSNSLAQQRSSVIDEETEWAALPFEERSARLFR